MKRKLSASGRVRKKGKTSVSYSILFGIYILYQSFRKYKAENLLYNFIDRRKNLTGTIAIFASFS